MITDFSTEKKRKKNRNQQIMRYFLSAERNWQPRIKYHEGYLRKIQFKDNSKTKPHSYKQPVTWKPSPDKKGPTWKLWDARRNEQKKMVNMSINM